MGKYSVEVKPTAQKELEALPDPVLARIVRKLDEHRADRASAEDLRIAGQPSAGLNTSLSIPA